MILMLGQSRVAFAMSRDNLLPEVTSPGPTRRFRTPYRITILTGVVVAIIAAFVDLTRLAELVNIGTLSAFCLVSVGVMILQANTAGPPARLPHPTGSRGPHPAAILFCLYLMGFLPVGTWWRFLVWMAWDSWSTSYTAAPQPPRPHRDPGGGATKEA